MIAKRRPPIGRRVVVVRALTSRSEKVSVASAMLGDLVERRESSRVRGIQPSARHMLSRVISFNDPHANGQAWKTR